MTPMFRYFLGFQVPVDRAGWLARQLPAVSGDLFAGLKPQNYHLTLCTIAETQAQHPFLRQRVARAFEAGLPAASLIPFGRIVSREMGAELTTIGSVGDVRQLYAGLVTMLETQGLEPMHRKSGLRPHITLGYGACDFEPIPAAWRWTPRELVLIESHVGHSRHRVLQSWTLAPPAQGMFDFMADALPPPLRYAA
ncbi:2'-5' RNA ligase family protein [Sphingopyxis sp.]|uniref:2'-5' RNA ligase family protein n=1 Tax=Sphingopyxis sp. TaxID=1908224 RepID=UPI0035B31690